MPLDKQQRLALRRRLFPSADSLVFGDMERALADHVRSGTVVLDAGSGTGTWALDRHAGQVRLLVGADIEPPASRGLATPVVADLADLPFGDGACDVVLCYNVVEHLAQPERTLAGLARLLRPGGALLIKTPNLKAPATLISRFFPLAMRRRIKGELGVGAGHVFPTHYRCNTAAALDGALVAAGLQRNVLRVIDQSYDYLYFGRPTYALGLLYSRIVMSTGLRSLGNAIIAVYSRPRPL